MADTLDLRRNIEFNSRARSAVHDAAANEWEIETPDSQRTAEGVLRPRTGEVQLGGAVGLGAQGGMG